MNSKPQTDKNLERQRTTAIADFRVALDTEMQRLSNPTLIQELDAPIASSFRRALRKLGQRIDKDLCSEPSSKKLRQSISTTIRLTRERVARERQTQNNVAAIANSELPPNSIGKSEILRDAIDAIEAAAETACEVIDSLQAVQSPADNSWLAVSVLAVLFAVCLVLLWGGDVLMHSAFIKQEETKWQLMAPVVKGIALILQIVTVISFAALIVAILLAMRVVIAEKLGDKLVDRILELFRSIAPNDKKPPAAQQSRLKESLFSMQSLILATAGAGVVTTGVTAHNNGQPLVPPPQTAEVRNAVAEVLKDFRPGFDTAVSNLDTAAKHVDEAAQLLGQNSPGGNSKNCGSSPSCGNVPTGGAMTLTLEKPIEIKMSPPTMNIDIGGLQPLADLRDSNRQLHDGMTNLSSQQTSLRDRFGEVQATFRNAIATEARINDDRIWRLCFETYRLSHAAPTLRQGKVGDGSGEAPNWDDFLVKCDQIVPRSPTVANAANQTRKQ